MFDVRYHLVSLVAVFLALALGILMGSVIAGRGTLVERQNALIEGIQADVNRIQKENKGLHEELKNSENLKTVLFTALIKEQLNQRKIAIFSTTSVPKKIQKSLSDLINQAGGQAVFIFLSPDLQKNSSKSLKKLKSFFPEDISSENLKGKILGKIASETVNFSDPNFLKALLDLKMIQSSEDSLQAEAIVLFAGGDEKSEVFSEIHLPFIQEFQKLGMAVVGIEDSGAKISHMTFYQEAGISTVDNIDTTTGQIALVYVFNGRTGSFGAKPSAQSLLPPLRE